MTMMWREHQPNPHARPGPDYRAMNMLAAVRWGGRPLTSNRPGGRVEGGAWVFSEGDLGSVKVGREGWNKPEGLLL